MTAENTTYDEAAVIEKAAAGDRRSFKLLYDTYKDRVFSSCMRMLGSRQDAEDALQDVFVKVHRYLGSFKGNSAFSTWLYRIASNVCIEYLRKRKKDRNRVDIDVHDDPFGLLATKAAPDSARMIFEREINALPEGCRTVFVLHAVEGYKHREIAKMLKISQGTSKSQYYQAREHLRNNLAPYLEVLRNELF